MSKIHYGAFYMLFDGKQWPIWGDKFMEQFLQETRTISVIQNGIFNRKDYFWWVINVDHNKSFSFHRIFVDFIPQSKPQKPALVDHNKSKISLKKIIDFLIRSPMISMAYLGKEIYGTLNL